MKKENSMPKMALDVDFINILRCPPGATLTERRDKKVNLSVGDRLLVQETFAYAPGGVAYYADAIGDPFACFEWRYANTMPEQFCRYLLEVRSITSVSYREYLRRVGTEIYYNRRSFALKGCPQSRWFRSSRPVPPPVSDVVTVIEYELLDLDGDPVVKRR